jgi:hypothetical protein
VDDAPGEYSYDEAGAHTSPGPGFDQLWTYLRNDTPLPGSPAAAEFGTTAAPTTSPSQAAAKPTASASPTVALKTLSVTVYNGTDVSGEAARAAANLQAMGMTTSVGRSGYSGYSTTTIYYPAGDQARAQALADQIAGSVIKQSTDVSTLTLVIGDNVPSAIVADHSGSSSADSGSGSGTGSSASAGASASPSPTLSVQTRNGDEDLCSNLPGVVSYGGSPSD